jgi:uroporphyrinogen decarboxylase
LRYYQLHAGHPAVGACISNDDWGFKTQTMLSPADLRKYVFPWHQQIAHAIHAAGKPAILHSCGQLTNVMDDIIDTLKFDGKHSYEDTIVPVEQAYEKWGRRIATLGGIDVDFVCRAPLAEIRQRSANLLQQTSRGGYGLGSGNSIPTYVPNESYFAMIEPALV